VERDAHLAARSFLFQRARSRSLRFGKRPRCEALDQNTRLVDTARNKRFLDSVHHRAGAADEENNCAFHVDKPIENLLDLRTIKPAVEEFNLFLLVLKEMHDLQAV